MTTDHDSGTGKLARRDFMKKGAWAAVLTAAGAGAAQALPAEAPPPGTSPGGGLLDVRDFGARGDGTTDDTEPLREAIRAAGEKGAAGVFLPAGVYPVSDALYLPSNFRLVGAGRDATYIQAVPETLFPRYKPDPRTADIRARRTLLTTESVSTVREQVVQHVTVERLTLDWNHCPTEGYGHSVALMDSVDFGTLREVAFINCMPSDHPDTPEEVRAGGANFRCECVMYANARHGLMERCFLTDSGYRPLSVSYGSLDIVFRNGVIYAENPVWRHAFSENHGDGIPRDEHFVHSQVVFQNSTFILERGTAGDGICSHTGTTHVENCDFYIKSPATGFWAILRPFDGSRNCIYTHNRFHCDGEYPAHFCIMNTTRRTRDERGPDEDIVFSGNLVHVSFGREQNDRRLPVVRFLDGDRRVRVENNNIRVRWLGEGAPQVLLLERTGTFSVQGNLFEIEKGDREGSLPDGILLEDCRNGCVTGNVITGVFRHGIRTTGESPGIAVSGNSLEEASGDAVRRENG